MCTEDMYFFSDQDKMTIFASQSQNQGDLETRFSQLLQPIRDLTKNWDVNIAEHLEDYLYEVCLK
jgi:hypothetical protein